MDIDRMNALERASEGILRELWVATTEIKKLKEMNHACMNMIDYQKMEAKRLMEIIETQNIEISMMKCRL
jgi:glutamate formiminotransferase